MSLILFRSETSRGLPPFRSSHFVKSISFTSCSTGTSVTRTLTGLNPCAIPTTHSLPRTAANPSATASYSVVAVTSTVWETPSISCMVTRHERTGIAKASLAYSLFVRQGERVALSTERTSREIDFALGHQTMREDLPLLVDHSYSMRAYVPCSAPLYRPAFFVLALDLGGNAKAFSISSGDFQNCRSCSAQLKRFVR